MANGGSEQMAAEGVVQAGALAAVTNGGKGSGCSGGSELRYGRGNMK